MDIEIGDYVYAHSYSDDDPNDPWAVGFLQDVFTSERGTRYRLKDTGLPPRYYRHCRKITKEEGERILEERKQWRSK